MTVEYEIEEYYLPRPMQNTARYRIVTYFAGRRHVSSDGNDDKATYAEAEAEVSRRKQRDEA